MASDDFNRMRNHLTSRMKLRFESFFILLANRHDDDLNIFGGIARTDRIAAGVVAAIEEPGDIGIPVVVRLEGTNVEQGRQILQDADFDFIVAEHMADAAEKVVKAAGGAS